VSQESDRACVHMESINHLIVHLTRQRHIPYDVPTRIPHHTRSTSDEALQILAAGGRVGNRRTIQAGDCDRGRSPLRKSHCRPSMIACKKPICYGMHRPRRLRQRPMANARRRRIEGCQRKSSASRGAVLSCRDTLPVPCQRPASLLARRERAAAAKRVGRPCLRTRPPHSGRH